MPPRILTRNAAPWQTVVADLLADGTIAWGGKTFTSPSAWSLYYKRLKKPDLKTDAGWRNVHYGSAKGPLLESLKIQYELEIRGEEGDGDQKPSRDEGLAADIDLEADSEEEDNEDDEDGDDVYLLGAP